MEELILTAEEDAAGARLDVFIAAETEALSRNAIQKLIEKQLVTVNAAPTKANYKLRKNDIVSMLIPDPEAPAILPENIPLTILYEDADLLVIDKPKGMVVHPAPGHYSGTLVNAV
ncbi:MAG: RNA pseudouridine synthase, partial [Clostridiales bacterium]|nr:RNA pseudouridine synthase [Clostridiales bacterium]